MKTYTIPGLPPPDGPIEYNRYGKMITLYAIYDIKSNLFYNHKLYSSTKSARNAITRNRLDIKENIIVEYKLLDYCHHSAVKS